LEVSLFPYLLGKLNVWFNYYLSLRAKCNEAKQSRSQRDCHVASLLAMTPKILYRDLWKYDLSDADVIYFFLMPSKMNRLRKKFEKELKPGARVISYVWPIEGWTPIKVDECEGWPKIFLYEI